MERSDQLSLPTRMPSVACSFDALFAAYYRRLARLLYRATGDTGRAEELAAEAFWRLYRKPPSDATNLEGWLYRTGLRLALDHLKKERRRARYEALALLFRVAPNPLQAVEQQQTQTRVRQVLASLKPAQAAMLLLRSEGFSYAELATALNLSPASVGTLLARSGQAFKKEYLKRYGQQD
ncbi:MAG TPA: sigma-70 family RNA polymerase sigma factor [Blastocatellia bacterium]|nr:sigma-70 family RNA polymerase sigma factor [Blastocatellia bacterium]